MNEKKIHVGIKALIQNAQGKILVLKVNPDELKSNKHGAYWDIPGGRIKEGDSVEKTLKKEIEEELGIDDSNLGVYEFFHGNVSNLEIPLENETVGLVLLSYICKFRQEPKEIKLSFEHTEYKWVSVGEAKELLGVKFSKDFIEKLDKLK